MKIMNTVALVTGGGSGLGAETAGILAKNGARVAVLDINYEAALKVANKIEGLAVQCDVSSEQSVSAALDTIEEKLGVVQIVINSAGIGTAKRILGRDQLHPLENFTRVIDVNLTGSFNMLRLTAERMSAQEPTEEDERGVIIFTASIAAFEGQVGQAAYAASKGGIVSMTLPAARELAQFGIRVLTLAPGLFKTPLMEELPEEVQQKLGSSIPFPARLGKPEEFASLAMHCVENTFINGEVIRVDGGLRLPPR